MVLMTFHTYRGADGSVHVQNAVMGALGQHHVHTPEEFETWRKPGDQIIEHNAICSCDLAVGQARDHTGKIITMRGYQ